MFETIGTLLTIAFWAVAIFLFGGGIILCIGNFTSGKGGAIFQGIIAVILGVITFFGVYSWFESIVWCLLFSGIVLGLVATAGSNQEKKAPQREKEYGLTDAIVDTYCEYELTKAAVKDAIRESKE